MWFTDTVVIWENPTKYCIDDPVAGVFIPSYRVMRQVRRMSIEEMNAVLIRNPEAEEAGLTYRCKVRFQTSGRWYYRIKGVYRRLLQRLLSFL